MQRSWIVLLGVALLPGARGVAADLELRLTVDAGTTDRQGSPATAVIPLGGRLPSARRISARLADPAGKALPCQAEVIPGTGDRPQSVQVHWIEAGLAAGKSRSYQLRLSEGAGEPSEGFRFVDGPGYRDLFRGPVPIWRHMTAYDPQRREETYKPYLHVHGFHQDGFITKGPGGLYTHHRGIFLGWNKTFLGEKSLDFWHCPNVSQRHRNYLLQRETLGPVVGRTAAATEWADPEGKAVARDAREVAAWIPAEGELLLDFDITLEAVAGDLRLEGDPQHAGFQFRATQEVAEHEKDTVYVLPGGSEKKPNDVVEKCPWAACLFKVGGKPYLVMHMDHPGNPRPAVYSTRSYGRFGAFFTGNLKVGSPLRLRYRILVIDPQKHPDLSEPALAKRYADFTTPLSIRVE
jgi:hypothetical protein